MPTNIEWCDETWNPIRARRTDATPADLEIADLVGWHCERVSPGCQHCYAETINEKRFGTGLPYNRKSRDQVRIELDEKALTQPLHWRRPRKVFVCSMTDLFGEWVPDEVIDRVFAVMALAPQHTFQVLTKRPERMRDYVGPPSNDGNNNRLLWLRREAIEDAAQSFDLWPDSWEDGMLKHGDWPPSNIWFGTSVEDQPRANERIGHLLATPAAVRFLSCEPLLGEVDLRFRDWARAGGPAERNCSHGYDTDRFACPNCLHWVIVGGESGPGARACDLEWVRGIVGQCQAAGVAVFVKQVGSRPIGLPPLHSKRKGDTKGGAIETWPEDLRVREFPNA